MCWSAKEAVFKWDGEGGIDFRQQIHLRKTPGNTNQVNCTFTKGGQVELIIELQHLKYIVLAWVAH